MRINNLKINGFGKIVNKEIELKDKINIVYGLNESGKSTIQKFIFGIIFGLSKNKNGKNESELDKLYPWKGLEYSGKINYTLDNGKQYEVFRDFLKKNPIIYENKLDVSNNYIIDKNKGVLFFEEQTGIDEKTFLDTAMVMQQNVKLDKSSQANLIQKITNILSSGDENISYNITKEKILKLQNEKIGSYRTFNKPINEVNNNILKIEEEQMVLKNSQFELDDINNEEQELYNELEQLNYKLDLIKDMKLYLESSKIQNAEVDFNKRLELEYDEKIQDLKNKIDINSKQNIRLQKKKYTANYIIELVIFIMSICTILFIKNYLYIVPLIILFIINFVYILTKKIDDNKKINNKLKEIDELQLKIDKEIEILNKSKQEKQFETKIKSERLNISILKNEENLSEKYHGKIEEKYIENIFAMDIDELSSMQLTLLDKINDLKMQINSLNLKKESLQNKLKKVDDLNSNLQILTKEKDDLDSLNNSFKLALDTLEEAYKEMKERINPDLTENLSKIVMKISNGKYTNIIFDDENGLCVELENGKYLSCDSLSIGTIDQIYLSLRLAVLEQISEESIPIILDEAFAYFDNERLESFLKYIISENIKNQIIIFTCSNREIDILNKLKYDKYNYIHL